MNGLLYRIGIALKDGGEKLHNSGHKIGWLVRKGGLVVADFGDKGWRK